MRKGNDDIDILIISKNGDRKIMHPIAITTGPVTRMRKWNRFSQFQHSNQKATSCPNPQGLTGQMQVQKPNLVFATCLPTLRVESSIIDRDGNIIDNIIRKVINVQ